MIDKITGKTVVLTKQTQLYTRDPPKSIKFSSITHGEGILYIHFNIDQLNFLNVNVTIKQSLLILFPAVQSDLHNVLVFHDDSIL